MRAHRTGPVTGPGRTRTSLRSGALGAGVVLVLLGCAPAPTGNQPGPLASIQAERSLDTVPLTANTAPEALVSDITDALNSLASASPEPDAAALRAAFESAGADGGAVEVSVDTTPTGLEVDAMTGAVPEGETCIFGHIRAGVVTVTQLPVLADGRCFIGDQR